MIYIIGYGAMARAIASSLDIPFAVVGRDEEKLKKFAREFKCPFYLLDEFDLDNKIVMLAIKPYALEEVAKKIKGKAEVLISILAGKSLESIKRVIEAEYYIRAMPNIGAKFGVSATALTGDIEAKKIAIDIFSQIGEVIWMNSDDEIDMATAFVGSGPAFLAIMAEAFSDGGVYIGLKRDDANRLTKLLFKSFAGIEMEFSKIKDEVMSPKGTTAEGIKSLEENGIRGKIMEAVKKTYDKSKKI